MGIESLLHDEQTAVNIYFLDNHADVCDLKQVLAAARRLEQTARVRDRLLGVPHEGVLPVCVALVMAIAPAAHELALDGVPLVPPCQN